ncbi:MAG: arsenosugar biosynthesis radical SAM protein ArsS [Ignavibacteriae bacterium]|nr:arsenosugar biosynthesis radical SAM protein ArsS [Ignavibacteriota bacterium]
MIELPILQPDVDVVTDDNYNFDAVIHEHGLRLKPLTIETLQANITKLCNQACQHCHVDASPKRTEQMDLRTVNRCLEILAQHDSIRNLDLTGGAPELNPHFDYFVIEAKKLGKHIIVRHNLTVTFDGNPRTGESKHYLPQFFTEHQVEVIASLPCYLEQNTDKQRGKGVFTKSIESIKLLNAQGYGIEGTGLLLNLVYNPIGASLPPPQESLEAEYKRELFSRYGIRFNNLYTVTNMPIHRFKEWLERSGSYETYMMKLMNAFNPSAAQGIMCRSLLSVGYDGRLYDCDFNQMLEMQVTNGEPKTVFNFDFDKLIARDIRFGAHCFGCTAGAGSSCGGALTA